jgi:hypothetical protein
MKAEIAPARFQGASLLRPLCMAALALVLGPLAPSAHAASPEPEPSPTLMEEFAPRVKRAAQAASEGRLAAARGEFTALTPEEARLPTVLFTQACIALEAGDLEGAARALSTFHEVFSDGVEVRVLGALLKQRREHPSIGWFDAYIQAWNDAGRPNLKGSSFLREDKLPVSQGPELESRWRLAPSTAARAMLALALDPEAERGRFLLQHLRELDPPEMIFAASGYLQRESLPESLRTESAKALRVRLAELAKASPQAMQYPALLLLLGSSPETPLTSKDVREIEAIAALSHWRETSFSTLFQAAYRQIEVTGVSQSADHAFDVAVMALAIEPAYLLKRRTESSRKALPQEEFRRLCEALWRIGSHLAAESSMVERFLGIALMRVGASELKDEARLQRATAQYEETRDAWWAIDAATPSLWPLYSLRQSVADAGIRDEVAYMRRFLPASPPAP